MTMGDSPPTSLHDVYLCYVVMCLSGFPTREKGRVHSVGLTNGDIHKQCFTALDFD